MQIGYSNNPIVIFNLLYLQIKSLSFGSEMSVQTSRFANIWSQIKQMWVILDTWSCGSR